MNAKAISLILVSALVVITGILLLITNKSGLNGDSVNQKDFTVADVQKHNKNSDCWTIINSSVYDITSYISKHPGGDEILQACGRDATNLFTKRTTDDGEKIGSGEPHSSSTDQQLKNLKIGNIVE